MENIKEIPEVSSSSQLSRQYLLAMGSVAHYLKQVEEYHESHQTAEPLPPRWLNLAERSLLHRPILKYQDYFSSVEFKHPSYNSEAQARLKSLDVLVENCNELLRQEGILSKLKAKNSSEFENLKNIYRKARNIVLTGQEA